MNGYSSVPRYIISHNDADGIAATMIYQWVYPGTELIGLYDFKKIEFYGDWTLAKTRNNPEVLYLDLDICRHGYQSYGHHLTSPNNSVPMPNNPNYICGITDLKNKFPLSTVLMLTEHYKIQWSTEQMQHLWMIDGAVCNFLKYRENVLWWLERMPHVNSYGLPRTPTANMDLDNFLQAKVTLSTMAPMVKAVTQLTGMSLRKPDNTTVTRYDLEAVRLTNQNDEKILEILKHPRLFSLAIINRGKVSYTLLPMGQED